MVDGDARERVHRVGVRDGVVAELAERPGRAFHDRHVAVGQRGDERAGRTPRRARRPAPQRAGGRRRASSSIAAAQGPSAASGCGAADEGAERRGTDARIVVAGRFEHLGELRRPERALVRQRPRSPPPGPRGPGPVTAACR